MLSYRETVQWLMTQLPMYQRQGQAAFKKNLDNILALCDAMGNPQHSFPSVHVAGTNGKGTVSHLVAAALQANGLSVGVYTSPHYKDYRERIKINGQLIPAEAVIDFVGKYRPLFEELKPSFFEMTVALAFDYFARAQVDVAIIEVGLGGRLDSTNVIKPLLSIITNISYDHMAMLGDTLPLIAKEKAGIIKPTIPVIVGERQKEVSQVFVDRSTLLDAPLLFASDVVELAPRLDGAWDVSIKDRPYLKRLRCDLKGPFVERNLSTALAAIHHLGQTLDLDRRKIKQGLKNVSDLTYYIGRWQTLRQQPLIIAESAHNEAGLKDALAALLELPYDDLHIVLGFAKDKDVQSALALFPKNATYYWAKADIPRGMPADQLAQAGAEVGLVGETYSSVAHAYRAALDAASPKDLIYVGGSIFVVAEVL